jgi:hypothetical protein
MSKAEQRRQVLVDKRARALATMLLTRREDLLVEEVGDDIGLDYIVRFPTAGKPGVREFGIALRGAREAATAGDAAQVLRPVLRQLERYGPFARPVCLFLFAMDHDRAWYTWVAEPYASGDGTAGLRPASEPDCLPLDQRALRGILARVDAWYDALFPSLSANGPGVSRSERRRTKP